jgi:hypothetical protein
VFALRGGPPWQLLPQPARREDDGEESGHAEREERPDKEEGSVGLGETRRSTQRSASLHISPLESHHKPERCAIADDVASGRGRVVGADDQDWLGGPFSE